MNRSHWKFLSLGAVALLATPAFAQQPIQPQPAEPLPPYEQKYADPTPSGQYDPQAQAAPPAYSDEADDDDDDDYDVTYDVSAERETEVYDDGYDPNAYQQFESTLSPYGSWEDVPSYGRVWVPSTGAVGVDFAPYASGGHFVMSDYGWTWASDYDWGWAPFHYGRWLVVGGHGWCWLPGTVWGPAWVNWRWGGGYVGWSPMSPRGIVVGPPRGVRGPWHFTVAGQLGGMRPRYLPARVIPSVWARTSMINNAAQVRFGNVNVRVNAGPPAAVFRAATGRTIVPAPLAVAAPRALPRAITPRVGAPLVSRPWMQARPVGGYYSRPVTGARTLTPSVPPRATVGAYPGVRAPYATGYRGGAAPMYRVPPPAVRPGVQGYSPPLYRSPPPANYYRGPGMATPPPAYRGSVVPNYNSPAPSYNSAAPNYSSPAPSYNSAAPVYNTPTTTYRSPPMYHAPSPSPVFRTPPPASYSAPAPVYRSPPPAANYQAPAPMYHAPAAAPSYHSPPPAAFHGGGSFGGRRR